MRRCGPRLAEQAGGRPVGRYQPSSGRAAAISTPSDIGLEFEPEPV
jgi:hypothetical protein